MLRPLKEGLSGYSRAGISLHGQHAAVARVERQKTARPRVSARAIQTSAQVEDWPEQAIAGIDLGRAPVSAVLTGDAYQLQLVEKPNVPDDELQDAVRWRLQHLIDYPVDEAVVQVFEMPPHANVASPPTAYAVVSPKTEILDEIARMQRAELRMDVIDIPELCVRNVAVSLPQDNDGVAFLHFTEDCGYLTITRRGVLHLLRRIETSRDDFADHDVESFLFQEQVASISLEVQRSLDYYESHYDSQPVSELVIGPGHGLDALTGAMQEQLGIGVGRLDFNDLFDMDSDISAEEQGYCLLAIGAALRTEVPATKATLQ